MLSYLKCCFDFFSFPKYTYLFKILVMHMDITCNFNNNVDLKYYMKKILYICIYDSRNK